MAGSAGVSIRNAISLLREAGVESPQHEARLILAKLLELTVTRLIAHPETHLSGPVQATYDSMIRDRARRKPLAYILGEWEFYGMNLTITPDVLVPRPETELLVETTTSRLIYPKPCVADIGTGSGAIAVAIAASLPSVQIVATDISPNAVQVARANAEKYNFAERIEFLEGDLLEPLLGREPFDAIVSNPPYVRRSDLVNPQPELLWEPKGALDGGEDGLDIYRRLIPGAFEMIKETGFTAMEVGMGQADDVSRIALGSGYSRTEKLTDLAGIERVVVAWK